MNVAIVYAGGHHRTIADPLMDDNLRDIVEQLDAENARTPRHNGSQHENPVATLEEALVVQAVTCSRPIDSHAVQFAEGLALVADLLRDHHRAQARLMAVCSRETSNASTERHLSSIVSVLDQVFSGGSNHVPYFGLSPGFLWVSAMREALIHHCDPQRVKRLVSELTMTCWQFEKTARSDVAIYYNDAASTYDADYTDPISVAENAVVADILSELVQPNTRVLDIGCGTGLGLELLDERSIPLSQYLGIDISPEMISRFVAKHGKRENVSAVRLDAQDAIVLGQDTFDSVISLFGSFSHSMLPHLAWTSIESCLSPGGTIFFMVYSDRWRFYEDVGGVPGRPISYRIRNRTKRTFVDARAYLPGEIRRVFTGLKNVEVHGLSLATEIPLLKPVFRSLPTRAVQQWLSFERSVLSNHPKLFHTLIITGVKG